MTTLPVALVKIVSSRSVSLKSQNFRSGNLGTKATLCPLKALIWFGKGRLYYEAQWKERCKRGKRCELRTWDNLFELCCRSISVFIVRSGSYVSRFNCNTLAIFFCLNPLVAYFQRTNTNSCNTRRTCGLASAMNIETELKFCRGICERRRIF